MAATHSLIVIAGPTASGKSSLAMQLALAHDGEVICADSQTLHRGLDLLTAKPTVEDQLAVPHWGVDLVDAGADYSVAQFQSYAQAAIADIQKRGKLPILVGGSGLYIDAVIYDFIFRPTDEKLRAELASSSLEELIQRASAMTNFTKLNNSDRHNPRRLQRFVATGEVGLGSTRELAEAVIYIGIDPGKEVLGQRIAQRGAAMFAQGLGQEEISGGGVVSTGAGILSDYQSGQLTEHQALAALVVATKKLAKKQLTWFKRDTNITWFNDAKEAANYVESKLTTFS